MNKIKLSFGIVTYNNADKIEKIINNIISVAYNYDYKIFCIDNGSKDETINIIKKSLSNNIILIESKNNGFGSGHNKVLSLLESDYHFVVNPDIIFPNIDENLSKMIDFLEDNKKYGLLTPLVKNKDESIQYLLRNEPTVFDTAIRFMGPNVFKKRQDKFMNKDSGYDKIVRSENATGCIMLFRTSILKKIEGFDQRYFMYYEDSDITKKVLQVSDTVFYPESYVIHEWQRANRKKIKFILINFSSMIKFMNKWGWKFI